MRNGLRLLGRMIRDEPWTFTLSIVGSIVFSLVTIASAYILGALTQHIIAPALSEHKATTVTYTVIVLVIVGVTIVKLAGIFARRLAAAMMQFRLFDRYRMRVVRKLLTLSARWHRTQTTGESLSAISADISQAFQIVAPLPFAVGTAVLILVSLVSLFFVHWSIALIGFTLFPLLFIINAFYTRMLAPRAQRSQELRARVASIAHESFDGAVVVKTLGAEERETQRMKVAAEDLRDAQIHLGRVRSVFDPFIDALPTFATLAALFFGAQLYLSNAISVGDVVSVSYLFSVLAFPVRAIGWLLGGMPQSLAGWERVEKVLRADDETTYGDKRLSSVAPAHLELRNVSVRVSTEGNGDITLLRDVSAEIRPGRTVAIVGPTGSGKSTIAALFARVGEADEGQVLLDGVPVHELAHGQLPQHVAWVGQGVFVFDDTIRENLTLGEEFSNEEIARAVKIAQFDEVVAAHDEGLETQLGERGTSLSGGQRQRLALARAVLRTPRLLVLDDATSAVDPRVEQQILRALHEGSADTTLVMVAYRASSIRLADEVIYVEQGQIVDVGTHEELRERQPGYRDVVTAYEKTADQKVGVGV